MMRYTHPPVHKLWHRQESSNPIETMIFRLSPESIGRIGGEMTNRMIKAAQSYLEEVTVKEVKKAFYHEFQDTLSDGQSIKASPKHQITPEMNHGESHANQYHDDNSIH
jgi:hypothetical protein